MISLFKKQIKPKFLSMYIRSDGHLFLIPSSFNKDNWIVSVDYVGEIPANSTQGQFLVTFKECLSKCNVLKPIDLNDKSILDPLCKITGFKTYSRAVKGMKLVTIKLDEKGDYSFTPTEKKKGHGYQHIEEKSIVFIELNLVDSILKAIDTATIISE